MVCFEAFKSLQTWRREGTHATQVKVPQRKDFRLFVQIVQVVSQACPDLRQGAGAYTLSHQLLVKGHPRGHKFPAACEQNWLQKLKGKLL